MRRTKPRSVQKFVRFSLLLKPSIRKAAAWGASGHVTVVVDCSAALHARVHCPSMPLAGRHLAQLLQALSRTSLKVQLEWVPAHGRHTAWKPSNQNLDVLRARRLNEAADSSAKACVNRRLRGSPSSEMGC